MRKRMLLSVAVIAVIATMVCGCSEEKAEITEKKEEVTTNKKVEKQEVEEFSEEEKKSIEASERLSELGYKLEDFSMFIRNPKEKEKNEEQVKEWMKKMYALSQPGTKKYEVEKKELEDSLYTKFQIEKESPIILKVKESEAGLTEDYFYLSDEGFLIKDNDKWYELKFKEGYKTEYMHLTDISVIYAVPIEEGSFLEERIQTYTDCSTEEEMRKDIEEGCHFEASKEWMPTIKGSEFDINVYKVVNISEGMEEGTYNVDIFLEAYYVLESGELLSRSIELSMNSVEDVETIVKKYTSEEKVLEMFDICEYK